MTSNRPQTAADVAAGLRAIAARLDALGDAALPNVYIGVDILPNGGEDIEIAAIDLLGQALYGQPGTTRELSGGTFHHRVTGHIDGIEVAVYTAVSSPAERRMRAELARLDAELTEAVGILAAVGDALSPTGERPEAALGTLASDVAAYVEHTERTEAERDRYAAELTQALQGREVDA